MTTTTNFTGPSVRTARPTPSLWTVGGLAAATASIATIAVAEAADAAGVSLAVGGEDDPGRRVRDGHRRRLVRRLVLAERLRPRPVARNARSWGRPSR